MTEEQNSTQAPSDRHIKVARLINETFPELAGAGAAHVAVIDAFVTRLEHGYVYWDQVVDQVLRMRSDHMVAEHQKYEGLLAKQKFESIAERFDSMARAKDATEIKNKLLVQERVMLHGLLSEVLTQVGTGEPIGASWNSLLDKIKGALQRELKHP